MSPKVLLQWVWTLLPSLISAYQAPEDKEDIFTTRPCPAFLVFDTAAYLADMTIELPCHCKPADVLSVVWYYQKHLGTKDAKVLSDFSGNSVVDSSKVGRNVDLRERFSIRLFSLVVFRVQLSDSGHYICGSESGEYFYGYNLDVQTVRHFRYEDLNQTFEDRASDLEANRNEPFWVFTNFWPWSVCDRCGTPGEQIRIGLCYVMSQHLQVRYLRRVSNISSCGSSSVPQRFGLSGGAYGAELSIRTCKIACPPQTTNPQHQALLEFLSHSDPSSSGISIYYHNHPTDTDLVLSCPGTRPEQAVSWDKDSTPLYRSHYMQGLNQNSRIFIDAGHHLHFRPVRLEDKGVYYCWIQGKKAAEIRLGVYSRLGRQRRITDPESIFAMTVILLCYVVLTVVFLLIIAIKCIWLYRKEGRAAY
ncbi:Ig-like V-type domain-containing protein FAM187A [Trichomycterus rosablanca]|uniref:Ig-like V-type domain-containing protein FAM187A n=1 Tax=Trichomycterus rosablanca TaxID=2290929 RepID=UPI002F360640